MSLTSRWWVHTVTDDMGNAGHALYYGSHRVDLEERDVLERIARAMNNQVDGGEG